MTAQCAKTVSDIRCPNDTIGKSRYCKDHRAESRANFKNMIAEQAQQRADRDTKLAELFRQAHEAGRAAAVAHTPEPMTVVQRANPLDDSSPIVKAYGPYAEGVCGFAWIVIHPGNCPAANYAKKHLRAGPHYGGGTEIYVSDYGQSYERKMEYARAFAKVLQSAGIKAYSGGRLD
jgi:hypothetical protein